MSPDARKYLLLLLDVCAAGGSTQDTCDLRSARMQVCLINREFALASAAAHDCEEASRLIFCAVKWLRLEVLACVRAHTDCGFRTRKCI